MQHRNGVKMNLLKKEELSKIEPMFHGWEETMIWSCLQGVMGQAWADSLEHPSSAQIIIGDFCFMAGKPDKELAAHIPESFPGKFLIMVPKTLDWNPIIEEIYGQQAEKALRYAIKKEKNIFSREKLKQNAENLSSEYSLAFIDEKWFHYLKQKAWSRDLCSQYQTYEEYKEKGLGVTALYKGIPVSGASSYTSYLGGIEIEIDTMEAYRRKGLAYACASRLILECLDRGLYPSWDAADLRSVSLARKLGYHPDREYTAYYVEVQNRKTEDA